MLLGFPAEQSSVSSTAGLELQGHTVKAKASSLPALHSTLSMDHFLSWPSGCSERDRSQLTEGWETSQSETSHCMYVYLRCQKHSAKTAVPIRCGEKCALMEAEALSHITQTHTHTTCYLLTSQTSKKKVPGSIGSEPQTNWALTHTINIAHLWPLVPGWTREAIIESWLASESMTQNQEGNQEHFLLCFYVGVSR